MSKAKRSVLERIADMFMRLAHWPRPQKANIRVIDDKVLEKERKRQFEISRVDRCRYRKRYFTDSGIIGSGEFVSTNYERFRNLFYSKHERNPKPTKGLDRMYSLKRLAEG
jgi:putative transposase